MHNKKRGRSESHILLHQSPLAVGSERVLADALDEHLRDALVGEFRRGDDGLGHGLGVSLLGRDVPHRGVQEPLAAQDGVDALDQNPPSRSSAERVRRDDHDLDGAPGQNDAGQGRLEGRGAQDPPTENDFWRI